ncbi:MAG: sugar phosphate isomerase/epimerase family protein [Solirubrobacteraceae bacterium]
MIGGREVALAALTVLDAPPPEIVECAAEAGFDLVTLRIADATATEPNPLASDTPLRRATLARLGELRIGVLDVEVLRLSGDTDLSTLDPTLQSAAQLGARNLLVIAAERDEQRLVERFGEVCEQAAAFGLRAALEFMAFTACRTLEDACRIVQRAGHPAGAVLVDPLHLARSGGTPADVRHAVEAHPSLFPYAQLCDAPLAPSGGSRRELYLEAVADRLAPGDGGLPLRQLLAALPPTIPLSVETPVAALRDRSARERARLAYAATLAALRD